MLIENNLAHALLFGRMKTIQLTEAQVLLDTTLNWLFLKGREELCLLRTIVYRV